MVGANESYISLCRRHFREGKTYPDMQTKSDLPKRHMVEK